MRSLILLALAAMLLCLPGALGQMNSITSEELNASELQDLVANSSAKLESYRFTMEMEQSIDLVSLTSEETQRLSLRTLGFCSANVTDRAMKMVLASITVPEGDDKNVTAAAMEEYLLNDTVYLKMDGNWTALRLPGVAEAWSLQNTMDQQVDMLNHSHLTLQGSEIVDGQDCYKLLVDIDTTSFADQLAEQTGSYLSLQPMNFSSLFRNMTLQACYWITKDMHLLKKTEVWESFIVNPRSLGLSVNESENLEMSVNTTVTLLFSGFDQRINIELPAEAIKAEPSPLSMIASAEAVLLVPSGNSTNNVAQAALKA
ncbi:MAG: hypothetical protein NTV25_06880 [Methanothrix sp.]|nr:hypothetical protein [Methanothrix sp.]